VVATVALYDSLGSCVSFGSEVNDGSKAYASLLAPMKPPKPIEMAPAINSAKPPRVTSRALPNADNPAVRAKGTVNPSERPMMASEIMRGVGLNRDCVGFCSSPLMRGLHELHCPASKSTAVPSLKSDDGLDSNSMIPISLLPHGL